METRVALAEDVLALQALHATSFGRNSWSLEQIKGSLNLQTTYALLIEDEAAILGFIFFQIVGLEAEILTFCVAPSRRRQGIGKHLLCAAVERARQKNVKRIFLEVAEDNDKAGTLYEKSGFCSQGKRANYYQGQDGRLDALIYSLDL